MTNRTGERDVQTRSAESTIGGHEGSGTECSISLADRLRFSANGLENTDRWINPKMPDLLRSAANEIDELRADASKFERALDLIGAPTATDDGGERLSLYGRIMALAAPEPRP